MTIKWTPEGKVDRYLWGIASPTERRAQRDRVADALDVAVAALRELVALKDIKDQSDYNLLYAQTTGNLAKGKELELEYRSRKQDAWRAAREALRQIGVEK